MYIPFATVGDADNTSAAWWAEVRGRGWQPDNVTQFLYGRQARTGDPEADAGLPDGVDAAIVVTERDADLDTLIAADHMTATEAVPCAELYPTWATGTAYAVGDIVTYGADLYVVRQAHTSQPDWTPPQVLALYRVYRANADTLLDWIQSESVQVGWQRIYDGAEYECLQAHVTQADWTPPAVPALWQAVVAPSAEWQAGATYAIGDRVTYAGLLYECRQAHTSLPGWEPPNVLALWLPV